VALIQRVARSVAWSTINGWVQLAFSLLTFTLVTRQLGPALVGVWGVVLLIVGVGDLLTGGPLMDSIQQRRDLTLDQRNGMFWVGQGVAVSFACLAAAASPALCALFGITGWTVLLLCPLASLPLSAATSWCGALLGRELRFAVMSQINLLAAVASSLVAIIGVTAGFAVWSLLMGEICGRLIRSTGFWLACRARPGRPRNLAAAGALMRFNTHSFGVYTLGYADASAPAFLTGAMLGPRALGYLIIAQKLLSLLNQLVLSPLSEVSMAAAARVQTDPEKLKALVKGLYWMAAVFAYPAFLGAIVVTPDLARLMGGRWVAAALTVQLLLLVGLRTATGIFNIAILRGVGQSVLPLVLLSIGLGLNVLCVPIGARFGSAGVAAAIVVRTFAVWPLGCWMIKRSTGVSYGEQTSAGAPALAAAAAMALGVAAFLHAAPLDAPFLRLAAAGGLGVLLYASILAILATRARRMLIAMGGLALKGEGGQALKRLRSEFLA